MSRYVSVRISRLQANNQFGEAFQQVAHDCRSNVPSYIRRDDNNILYLFEDSIDKHQIISFNHMDSSSNTQSVSTVLKPIIDSTLADQVQRAKDDYKAHNGRSLPCNWKPLINGVITFGSDEKIEGANLIRDDEIEAINSIDKNKMDEAAMRYLKELEARYQTKAAYLVRHDDERTVHYHFMMLHYDFGHHRSITSRFKKRDLQAMGEELQDIAGESFQELGFMRGKKAGFTHAKHLSVTDMHKQEQAELQKVIQNEQHKFYALQANLAQRANEIEEQKQELFKYIKENKAKRAEVRTLDADVKTKKQEYQTIDAQTNRARAEIKDIIAEQKNIQQQSKKLQENIILLKEQTEQFQKAINQPCPAPKSVERQLYFYKEENGILGKKQVPVPVNQKKYVTTTRREFDAANQELESYQKLSAFYKDPESITKLQKDNEQLRLTLEQERLNAKVLQEQHDTEVAKQEVKISELQGQAKEYEKERTLWKKIYLKLPDIVKKLFKKELHRFGYSEKLDADLDLK